MSKKSNINISFIQVLRIIIFILLAWVIFVSYTRCREFLTSSPVFAVKDILVESSIRFIDIPSLRLMLGRNIFSIDIHRMQRQMQRRYPQITNLRVIRVLPDKIKILAQKRDVIFQITVKKGYLAVDKQGYGLFITPKPLNVPVIDGVFVDTRKITPGTALNLKPVDALVSLFNGLADKGILSKANIVRVNAGQTSKIIITVKSGFDILMDTDDVPNQVNQLEAVFKGVKIPIANIQYIDIRFKEPIIAEKNQKDKD